MKSSNTKAHWQSGLDMLITLKGPFLYFGRLMISGEQKYTDVYRRTSDVAQSRSRQHTTRVHGYIRNHGYLNMNGSVDINGSMAV